MASLVEICRVCKSRGEHGAKRRDFLNLGSFHYRSRHNKRKSWAGFASFMVAATGQTGRNVRFSTSLPMLYNVDMLKLQRVQNCLAREVTRVGCFAPSTPLRNSLHWLPISFRIQFKILTLLYKTLSSGKPSYLADLIHMATPNRNLRFNKGPLLSTPKCKTKTGTRVFSVCAPSLWNKLPLSIRSSESLTSFHQRLKRTSLA